MQMDSAWKKINIWRKNMNNETIKKFDIMIKLRGDNVYDLYVGGEWVTSRGSCDKVLDDVNNIVKQSLIS